MDDDIVNELRDWAYITNNVQGKATLVMLSGEIFTDAADEIERLRTEAKHWKTCANAYERGDIGLGDKLFSTKPVVEDK